MLVHFRESAGTARQRAPLLVEIKPAAIFAAADELLLAKLAAGEAFAKRQGWDFKVATETDVPADRLDNAKFLLRYLARPINSAYSALVLEELSRFQRTTVEGVMRMSQEHERNRAQLLTELWSLIAQRRIGVDLDKPLTMQSPVWSLENR